MRKVVLISGRLCTGKSGLAKGLCDEFGYSAVKTTEILLREAKTQGKPTDRLSLQSLGDEFDKTSNYKWVYDAVMSAGATLSKDVPVVVDNIRSPEQLEYFRKDHSLDIVHTHLYAQKEELERRYQRRREMNESGVDCPFNDADILKDDEDIGHFKRDADVRIFTGRSDNRDTLVRVAARLGLYSSPEIRSVDVVVGGQFGSEGKGHIAAYLAANYDVLVRVGGPNAGHTVSSATGVYTYHQLPSGARDTEAQLLLGPGMTIHVASLLKEIHDCKIHPSRLFIDPQVMVIQDQDLQREREMVRTIGSTGRGGGAAAARRILDRVPGKTKLARDVPELKDYVGVGPNYRGSTSAQLELAYKKGNSILLEGTQGSGLSLYHGRYPFVTSRDTNVAGCLAEAGISPSRVRKVLMVIRSTPIRVGDPDAEPGYVQKIVGAIGSALGVRDAERERESSGPLKHETTFAVIAAMSGLDPKEVEINEITSTTKRKRRVGWFDWEQFREACSLNAPTDIVLTFADYIDAKNQYARRFEQLTEDTIKFIEELERVAQAPVSLINTRFPRDSDRIDLRTVIDRRNWKSRRQF